MYHLSCNQPRFAATGFSFILEWCSTEVFFYSLVQDSPVVPIGRSPRTDVLLKSEKVVIEFGGCVLRLAGLYKADRGAHSYWLEKGTVDVRPDHILNLIHYEVWKWSFILFCRHSLIKSFSSLILLLMEVQLSFKTLIKLLLFALSAFIIRFNILIATKDLRLHRKVKVEINSLSI